MLLEKFLHPGRESVFGRPDQQADQQSFRLRRRIGRHCMDPALVNAPDLRGISSGQRQLGERGIDAWMGVGAYQDRYDYRYKRVVDISKPGPQITNALATLFTGEGR